MDDIDEIRDVMGKQVDLIIDSGFCGLEPTTVVSLVEGVPQVLREGKADPDVFR